MVIYRDVSINDVNEYDAEELKMKLNKIKKDLKKHWIGVLIVIWISYYLINSSSNYGRANPALIFGMAPEIAAVILPAVLGVIGTLFGNGGLVKIAVYGFIGSILLLLLGAGILGSEFAKLLIFVGIGIFAMKFLFSRGSTTLG